jgi:hypothetical protein
MCAQFSALGWVKRLFEKRAEYCWFDFTPIAFGGLQQLANFLLRQRKHGAALEQIAIEFAHVPLDGISKAALIHRCPQLLDAMTEVGRVVDAFF